MNKQSPAQVLTTALDSGISCLQRQDGVRYACACVTDGHDGHMVAAHSNADPVELAKMTAAFMMYANTKGTNYARTFFDEVLKRMAAQQEALA